MSGRIGRLETVSYAAIPVVALGAALNLGAQYQAPGLIQPDSLLSSLLPAGGALFTVILYAVLAAILLRKGVAPLPLAVVFGVALVAALIELPVYRRSETVSWWSDMGWYAGSTTKTLAFSVNLGAVLVPLAVCAYLLRRLPLGRTALAVLTTTGAAYLLAEVSPGQGVMADVMLVPLVAVGAAMALHPTGVQPVAFVSAVVGTLVGADLLHLGDVLRLNVTSMSVGGAGLFDALFLAGPMAAAIAPCAVRLPQVRWGFRHQHAPAMATVTARDV